jgi:hypothetical protein
MATINLNDQAQVYVPPTLRGIFLEDLKRTPELNFINTKVVAPTSYKKLKQVTVGSAGFRRLNQGAAVNTKPEFELVETSTALIEREIDYDAALLDELRDQANALVDIRAAHIADGIEAINRKIAANFWYGTDNDVNGFEGLESLVQLTDDAGGGDGGNHRSIYLIRNGDANNQMGVSFVYGGNRVLGLRYPTWQNRKKSDSASLEYDAEYNTLVARPGLEVLNKYACIRIKQVTAYGGSNPPADNLVYDAIAELLGDSGIDPQSEGWTAWMHPQVRNDLRKTRTNVNNVSRTMTGVVTQNPDEIAGIPIRVTPNLSITEA